MSGFNSSKKLVGNQINFLECITTPTVATPTNTSTATN